MIYFLVSPDAIKIGYTENLAARVRALQTASGTPLVLRGIMDGGRPYERVLYRQFKAYRIRGEWFSNCSEILTFIVKNCDAPPSLDTGPGEAWNKNRIAGRKKAFTLEEVRVLDQLLKIRAVSRRPARDWALFRLGLDTMLRTSDLRSITVGNVSPDLGKTIHETLSLRQKKTKQPVHCEIVAKTQEAVANYIKIAWPDGAKPSDLLFDICDRQHRTIIKQWAATMRLDPAFYSTHSIRRTKSKEIYRKTHNIEAVRQLLGHKSIGSAMVYLGVEEDDARALARKIDI